MYKRLWLIVLVLVVLIFGGIYAGNMASTASADIKHEVVFSIPVGDKGIHYAGGGNPDMLIWGPPSLAVAPDGTFWIADTPDNHLLHFNSDGVLLDKIDVSDFIIGAGDIEVTSNEIWVLDMASIPPKLVQLSLIGKVLGLHYLPKGLYPEDGLSGIDIGNDGSVLIEQGDGIDVTQFVSPSGVIEQNILEGYALQDRVYSAHPANLRSNDTTHGYILVGNKRIDVEGVNDLGGLSILNVDADGSFLVVVEEVALNPAIQVDQKVYRYDAFGLLTGMARIPLAEMYTSVAHGINVGPDGEVYILVTKLDRAEVQRLTFSDSLSPILTPAVNRNSNEPQVLSSLHLDCRSRISIISVAAGYKNNTTYLNSYHINDPSAECPSRTKPRYLTSAGNYSSVPYAWGIADTVAGFNSLMGGGNNRYFAGDYTDPNSGCGRGVDCSGLVSYAWNLGDHYGTCMLETISTQLSSIADLQPGDIMNRCNITPRHTIIFDSFYGSGMFGYEATTYFQYDRVVRIYRRFQDIADYLPRKYNNACSETYLPLIERYQEEKLRENPNPYPPPNPYP